MSFATEYSGDIELEHVGYDMAVGTFDSRHAVVCSSNFVENSTRLPWAGSVFGSCRMQWSDGAGGQLKRGPRLNFEPGYREGEHHTQITDGMTATSYNAFHDAYYMQQYVGTSSSRIRAYKEASAEQYAHCPATFWERPQKHVCSLRCPCILNVVREIGPLVMTVLDSNHALLCYKVVQQEVMSLTKSALPTDYVDSVGVADACEGASYCDLRTVLESANGGHGLVDYLPPLTSVSCRTLVRHGDSVLAAGPPIALAVADGVESVLARTGDYVAVDKFSSTSAIVCVTGGQCRHLVLGNEETLSKGPALGVGADPSKTFDLSLSVLDETSALVCFSEATNEQGFRIDSGRCETVSTETDLPRGTAGSLVRKSYLQIHLWKASKVRPSQIQFCSPVHCGFELTFCFVLFCR
jgi:hypothetical protein